MGDIGGMMKQAKKMYEDVQKVQEEMDGERIEATSGGGMVTATVSGSSELIDLKINPQVVDPDDVEMLQDLVITAVREAMASAKAIYAERMQSVTGGLAGPGGLGGLGGLM
jgi:hypothetical protein